MASVRNLKKDVNYLIGEVIEDIQAYLYLNSSKNEEKATALIEEAVELWNNLYERINHPNGKDDKKLVKKHYKAIRKDLMESCDKLFEKLSNVGK